MDDQPMNIDSDSMITASDSGPCETQSLSPSGLLENTSGGKAIHRS